MNFIFGLPRDAEGRTGVLIFVDRFSKMVHLAPVAAEVTADESAELFLDLVFRHHGLPESIVWDRDPRFTSAFWTRLFALLGTRLLMSTAAHPKTDGQTERVNRILEDVLRSYATSFASWSSFLPMAEFALNNSTHASTGLTPFFVNNARHPRVPALLAARSSNAAAVSTLGGGELAPTSKSVQDSSEPPLLQSPSPARETLQSRATPFTAWHTRTSSQSTWLRPPRPPSLTSPRQQPRRRSTLQQCPSFFCTAKPSRGLCVTRSKSLWIDRKPTQIDETGRTCLPSGEANEYFYLRKASKAGTAVTNLGANKLAPRFIGPFKIFKVIGDAYTLDIPTAMRLHPTFYVGRLKPYVPATIPAPEAECPQPARSRSRPAADTDAESAIATAPRARAFAERSAPPTSDSKRRSRLIVSHRPCSDSVGAVSAIAARSRADSARF
ncbi:hypothetical protein PF005_g19221 [Phytophthora fragariae]|uniref:Integrase catalytic domain-containing protein n=1 Tax=Phytophthora fragariae TaxID=53985 RepID=A0A6A3XT02_9STRA|nr:hypothetical protein PF003_g21224 [Phytophthora fragariae]KAE8929769.1 hypothetical protein PF009_g20124 [Phytophthora fragariae]KAE9090333.1 hypothetical protein PF007_g19274 [Phytophthora fragariae]KAE9120226.1 hypothetical protein PF006_g18175 [Phytophthora fragariae]KAE9190513.1 hypothetical protein PF005_g19221 [Phytophthora fragariae]